MTDDRELVGKAIAGDESAWREMDRLYRHRIFCICLKMMKFNAEQAEDRTQDVFIQIAKSLPTFRFESKLTTWIHRITVNECLMWMRSLDRKFSQHLSLDDLPPFWAVRNPTIEEKLWLEKMLAELPPAYLKTLVLHDVEGFEHVEVGAILGTSEGTSKSNLHKAKEKARKLLTRKANPRVFQPAF